MSERRLTIAEQKTLTRALRRSVRFVGDGEMAEAALAECNRDGGVSLDDLKRELQPN